MHSDKAAQNFSEHFSALSPHISEVPDRQARKGLTDGFLGLGQVAMSDCGIGAGSWERLRQSWYSKNKGVKVEILKKLYLAFE